MHAQRSLKAMGDTWDKKLKQKPDPEKKHSGLLEYL